MSVPVTHTICALAEKDGSLRDESYQAIRRALAASFKYAVEFVLKHHKDEGIWIATVQAPLSALTTRRAKL